MSLTEARHPSGVPRRRSAEPRDGRPGAAVRGRRPRRLRPQRGRPAAPRRRDADPPRVEVRALPGADRARARAPGCRACSRSRCPRRCGWPGHGHDDLVVAYPTVDRAALRELAAGPRERVTIMVDCVEHLDARRGGRPRGRRRADPGLPRRRRRLVAAARPRADRRPPLARADAASRPRRSRARCSRGPSCALDGLMSYEAHIAGVGDRPPGRPLMGAAIRAMQRASARELAGRRAAVVAAVREVAPLRFVNGGGTGSVERTAAEAGGDRGRGRLRALRPDAVRRLRRLHARSRPRCSRCRSCAAPTTRTATLLGGGYPASGAAGADRLPRPAPAARA